MKYLYRTDFINDYDSYEIAPYVYNLKQLNELKNEIEDLLQIDEYEIHLKLHQQVLNEQKSKTSRKTKKVNKNNKLKK